jgi:hypothetical protein
MTKMISTETVMTFSLPEEAVLDIIEGAGSWIGYWATDGDVSTENQTYTITDLESEERFTLYFPQIVKAASLLATGQVSVHSDIRSAIMGAFINYEDADLDAECYDCIIQVACFKDVIYG